MLVVITFLHHFALAYLIHYTILISADVYSYTLDHAVLELREPTEQAQAEEPANPELSQCKPWSGFENSWRAKKSEVAIPLNFKEFGKNR
jgi:hypothetical protein